MEKGRKSRIPHNHNSQLILVDHRQNQPAQLIMRFVHRSNRLRYHVHVPKESACPLLARVAAVKQRTRSLAAAVAPTVVAFGDACVRRRNRFGRCALSVSRSRLCYRWCGRFRTLRCTRFTPRCSVLLPHLRIKIGSASGRETGSTCILRGALQTPTQHPAPDTSRHRSPLQS